MKNKSYCHITGEESYLFMSPREKLLDMFWNKLVIEIEGKRRVCDFSGRLEAGHIKQ